MKIELSKRDLKKIVENKKDHSEMEVALAETGLRYWTALKKVNEQKATMFNKLTRIYNICDSEFGDDIRKHNLANRKAAAECLMKKAVEKAAGVVELKISLD